MLAHFQEKPVRSLVLPFRANLKVPLFHDRHWLRSKADHTIALKLDVEEYIGMSELLIEGVSIISPAIAQPVLNHSVTIHPCLPEEKET